jgi:predicted acylesterase/phospholipase RssA
MVYRLCSISGGGVRGIIPATIVKEMLEMSKAYNKTGTIQDLCDYVVGTSVGGILGAGLVVSKDGNNPIFTPDQVLDLLKDNAAKIFPKDANSFQHKVIAVSAFVGASIATFFAPSVIIGAAGAFGIQWTTTFVGLKMLGIAIGAGSIFSTIAYKFSNHLDGWFLPKYSRDGIDQLLQQYFANFTLTDTVVPFTTVSYSLEEKNPRVWSTFKAKKVKTDNFFLKDALGATSAAPTFFPHKVTLVGDGQRTYYDVDGGIFSNSPVNLAIAVLKKHADAQVLQRIEKEGMMVLSIGTGYHNPSSIFVPPSYFMEGILGYGILDPLVLKVMDATERDSIIQARYVLQTIRIDPKLDVSLMPMDQSDDNHIKILSKASDKFVTEHHKILSQYTNCMIFNEECKELITESTPDYSYDLIN